MKLEFDYVVEFKKERTDKGMEVSMLVGCKTDDAGVDYLYLFVEAIRKDGNMTYTILDRGIGKDESIEDYEISMNEVLKVFNKVLVLNKLL